MALSLNGTSGISGIDGSASTPALRGSDSNTGINFGSDIVNINTGGATRATVNSSGNLGVGNTDPSQAKAVIQSASGTQLALVKDNNGASISLGGVTQPRVLMEAHPTSSQFSIYNAGGSTYASPSWTERFRIESDGTLQMIGDANSGDAQHFKFFASGDVVHLKTNGTNAANHGMIQFRDGNNSFCGQITSNGSSHTTSYGTSSDYRLKENEVLISDGITRLKELKPYRFKWKSSGETQDGFFAHEAQTVVPEAIQGEKDAVDSDNNPVYQGIDQSKLVPLLTAALQEAVGKIETLETKVAALEAA